MNVARRLVERTRVHPRAAVDVVRHRVTVALEVLEPLELAYALVGEAGDRNGLYLAGRFEVDPCERARVVEERRRHQDAGAARDPVPVAETGQRIVRFGVSLLDRRPVQHPALTAVDLVEDDVPNRVPVNQDDSRVIRRPRRDERPVRALPEGLGGPARKIDADRGRERLLTRLDGEERRVRRVVDMDEMGPPGGELLGKGLRKAALDRDHVRDVVLVPVGVDHHQDLAKAREHVKEVAAHELRVLERDLRRKERLRNAAGRVHRVQAQVTGEVRDEHEAVVSKLRLDEEPCREERLDPIRSAPRSVRRNDRHRSAQEATASRTVFGDVEVRVDILDVLGVLESLDEAHDPTRGGLVGDGDRRSSGPSRARPTRP